jgi:hypothetical protein
MDDEARELIRAFVRGGFEPAERIVEILCEEAYEPGEVDRAEVESVTSEELAILAREQASWPEITDCDRLTDAFRDLNRKGVIALENAGYTQSDGIDDVREAYEELPRKSGVIGYCFYHGQDLERAVAGEGLLLSFGPIDPALEETDGPRIGRLVVEELALNDLKADWDGSFKSRINIPVLDWKKRRP